MGGSTGVAAGDEAPVDDLVDGVEELEEEDGVAERGVLEVLHGRGLTRSGNSLKYL